MWVSVQGTGVIVYCGFWDIYSYKQLHIDAGHDTDMDNETVVK